MIKKIILIILLFCAIVSSGKKGDPEYLGLEKKVETHEVLINSA